ncbi:MAG: SGNH/GDSL hydrolase family protein [Candidatus Wallbacteria bacterium]|nr:SGNH/GDSL hydrolase family protein [Candidatus Wallbacteria bacterium]
MKNQIPAFYRKFRFFLAVFLSVIGCDLLFSAAYEKQFGYPFAERVKRKELEKSFRIQSPVYHHDLKKNADVWPVAWAGRQYHLRTDSLGFKDSECRDVPLKKGNRVLFIGDSFTEGIGVDYDKTFCGLLGEHLKSREIEVLNAAVVSYSPIIYWRKIKYLIEETGLAFDEVVVFLDLSDVWDEACSYELDGRLNVTDKKKAFRLLYFLNERSALFSICSAAGEKIAQGCLRRISAQAELKYRYALGMERCLWTIDPEKYREYGKNGLQSMSDYMDKLRAILAEKGIRLTVVVYPWPDQIFHQDLNSIQVVFWKNWCSERSVNFLDLFPLFVKENGTIEESESTFKRYFIPMDIHWNEEGHRLVADRLFDYFSKRAGQD